MFFYIKFNKFVQSHLQKYEKSNINENPTNCKQRKLRNDDHWLTKTQVWFQCQIFTSYHSVHEKFILIQEYPLPSNIIFMVSICLKHCNSFNLFREDKKVLSTSSQKHKDFHRCKMIKEKTDWFLNWTSQINCQIVRELVSQSLKELIISNPKNSSKITHRPLLIIRKFSPREFKQEDYPQPEERDLHYSS